MGAPPTDTSSLSALYVSIAPKCFFSQVSMLCRQVARPCSKILLSIHFVLFQHSSDHMSLFALFSFATALTLYRPCITVPLKKMWISKGENDKTGSTVGHRECLDFAVSGARISVQQCCRSTGSKVGSPRLSPSKRSHVARRALLILSARELYFTCRSPLSRTLLTSRACQSLARP